MEVVVFFFDLILDFKVIYLICDFRGIIYLRFKGCVVNGFNIEVSVKLMCNRILMDVMCSYYLKFKYFGRMKIQLYEYLVENLLDFVYDFYSFMNIIVLFFMKGYVYNYIMFGSKKRGYYNIVCENLIIIFLFWCMCMKWEDVRVVD